MSKRVKEIISASIETKQKILADEKMLQTICDAVNAIADAQHLAAEFSGRFYKDRTALPSEALHCNTSYLTAVANDYSYDVIYSRIIEGTGLPGDVLVGLSTSGNSPNIVKAFEAAKAKQMIAVGFTGETGGKMK